MFAESIVFHGLTYQCCLLLGVIRLLRSLPSSPRHYTLGLSAEDGGGLQASQPAQVMVNVVDPSQHPPEFTVSLYSFSVPEDADVDQTVGQVEATSQEPGEKSLCVCVLK